MESTSWSGSVAWHLSLAQHAIPALVKTDLSLTRTFGSAQLWSTLSSLPHGSSPALPEECCVLLLCIPADTRKTSMFSEDFTDRSVSDLLGLSSYNMLWGSLLRVRHQKFWCKIALSVSCYRLLILPSIGDEKLNF